MVETGDKTGSQAAPTGKEVIHTQGYAAMMNAIQKSEGIIYDSEDEEEFSDEEGELSLEHKQRILAAVAGAVRNQGFDLNDIEDHEELMRQIYEENLFY